MPSNPWFHAAAVTVFALAACRPMAPAEIPSPIPTAGPAATPTTTPAPIPTATPQPTATPIPLVPAFEHVVTIVFENKEFGTVIGNSRMPYFNQLADSYTLLTQHFAVTHPSLPNYLALISGDTFGLDFSCTKCLYDAVTLPDLIEASGRTWKTYQEDMPSACFEGSDYGLYAMKHNPFIYFEPIRLNGERCARSVVPFTQLYADLAANDLPAYVFITPNLCNDAHDCGLPVADQWLQSLMLVLQPALEADGEPYLIIITWDEGQGDHSCCGLPEKAGGRIATILVSPQVKAGFEDDLPYTHYSVLKTIAESWQLPYIGHAADEENVLIIAPWK
ncbi:MAG: alkaline phosphatase family protein [Chloroflexota bacterium]